MRYKSKYENQMGKKVSSVGTHMPHAMVGIILKRRRKKEEHAEQLKGGAHVPAAKNDNPFPAEFNPGNM